MWEKNNFKCGNAPDIYFDFCGIKFPHTQTSTGFRTNASYFCYLYKHVKHDNSFYQVRSKACLVIGLSIMLHLSILLISSGDIHPNPGPTSKFSDVTICHSKNVRSIRNRTEKLDYIKCTLAGEFDIITLSETWLHNAVSNKNFDIPGYQPPFRHDRPDNSGYGGILVWVSSKLAVKRRPEVPEVEGLWLEVRAHNAKFLLGTFYRPPNASASFWTNLQEALDLVKVDKITNVILTGYLNADPHTQEGANLETFVNINHLRLHVHEPTRYENNSS